MYCRRLVIAGALTLFPAFAQVASDSISGDASGKTVPYQFGMIRDRIESTNGTATSANWSGYALVGATFKSAAGSWIVPAANCSGLISNKFAGFWVGLDGYASNSQTVEQIGTLSNCAATTPYYYAWYEFFPQGMYIITSVPIKPGDRISASVVYYSFNQKFALTIKNDTTGQYFTIDATSPAALRSSAEWIAEAPCCTPTGGILPLTDFGTATFGLDNTGVKNTNYATDSSITASIGDFPPVDIIEINKTATPSSTPTSTCSTLSSSGTSFSCTWKGMGR